MPHLIMSLRSSLLKRSIRLYHIIMELDNAEPLSITELATNASSTEDPKCSKRTATSRGLRSTCSLSSHSDSSTLIYDHEAYDQFQHRVQTLCKSLWLEGRTETLLQKFLGSKAGRYLCGSNILGAVFHRCLQKSPKFEIERLRGGGFNRIIGIKSLESSSSKEHRLILRIPRFEEARPDREVATLSYVCHRTEIPVATIVAKDFSSNNALGKPYVIQVRIAGKDLQMTWDDLNHEQRCSVARQHAKILLSLQSLTNATAGLIEADIETTGGGRYTLIKPYELKTGQGLVKEPDLDRASNTFDKSPVGFFLHQLGRWRAVDLHRWGDDDHTVLRWEALMDAAEDMDRLGLLKNDDISLCHLDLQPRNIMAEVQQDRSLSITGYLDWDSAVFAPKFVGCAPPQWLWDDDEGEADEDEERYANDVPSTPEKQELKRIFEEAVGSDYLHYAYAPQYPLARMLFRVAKNGIWSTEHIAEAERFLREWDELRNLLESEAFPGFGEVQQNWG